MNTSIIFRNLTSKAKAKNVSSLLNRCQHISQQSISDAVLNDIHKILHRAAVNAGIPKPVFHERERNPDATGYMGDIYFFTIQDQESSRKREVIVKKAYQMESVRKNIPIEKVYSNECMFYDKVWSTFTKFQQSPGGEIVFHKIPRCYATDMTTNKEMVVLEDLFSSSFESVNKKLFFDKDHFKLIFSNYGKFHALSLAYKSKYPAQFHELTLGFYDYWVGLKKIGVVADSVRNVLSQCAQFLDMESESGLSRKFNEYVTGGIEGFCKSSEFTGENSVILHGDCWSDNVMFKYDEARNPIDVRLIDFQFAKLGHPIHDLSYCFYSGATKEIFEDLDYYLKVYHYSLSKTLERLDCSSKKYSVDMLKNEWKNHCQFGFLTSLLILKEKCVYEKGMNIAEIIRNSEFRREAEEGRYNVTEMKERSLDLIEHMYTQGFL